VKVLVFGSRTYSRREPIHSLLDELAARLPEGERLIVINGFASGADRIADEWASAHDRGHPWRFAADWLHCAVDHPAVRCPDDGGVHRRRFHGAARPAGDDYCPLAGLRRNQRMLDEGQPDLALGFVDKPLVESRGSLDMNRRLIVAGVETAIYDEAGTTLAPRGVG
jgi:hypothetical protein